MPAHNLIQTSAVLNVSDLGEERNFGKGLAHFMIEFEKGRFGNFETNDPGRLEACDLAAELGADRAGRSGHHDDLALEASAALAIFQVQGGATHEIFYRNVTDLGGEALSFD